MGGVSTQMQDSPDPKLDDTQPASSMGIGVPLESEIAHNEPMPICRDRLKCEISNTAGVATLLGGFALGSMRGNAPTTDDGIDLAIYLTAFLSVHLCTCAALMSLMLFREANGLRSTDLAVWAEKSWSAYLLPIPLIKVLFGAVSYLLNALLISYRDLDGPPNSANTFTGAEGLKWFATVFGSMTVASVIMTSGLIMSDRFNPDYHKKYS